MANEYLYGAYGHIGDTVAQNAVQAGTTPVYVGTAPVNLVRGYADAGIINEPVKLSSLTDAQKKLGYSADRDTFTLCEVMDAHFDNPLGNIGPIYVINVLDPDVHRGEEPVERTLQFSAGRAEFASSTIILDTFKLIHEYEDSEAVSVVEQEHDLDEYGGLVSTLCSPDTHILEDGRVLGTLYHKSGMTKFSGDETSGHYLAVRFPVKTVCHGRSGNKPVKANEELVMYVRDASITFPIYDEKDENLIITLSFSDATFAEEDSVSGSPAPQPVFYYEEGEDYALDYNFTKGTVIVSSLKAEEKLAGSLTATFYEADGGMVEDTDIIGGVTQSGEYSGISAVALLYPEQYAVCSLLAAPGWSHVPAVYNAMVTASQGINGHWDAFVLADLPLVDSGRQAVDTIEKAIAWKRENAYDSERSKVFWPQAVDNLGRVYHLSTLAAVEFMRADHSHGSVPMETCGNKAVPVVRQYFGPGSVNRGFDQQAGKELTQKGISTVVAWAGEWVLWGDHTAAYAYGADVDPRGIFDVSMRMLMHITNSFQREWSPEIDEPMTRALKDRIINREQEKLDGYVSQGALIGTPAIVFLESENSTADIMNGDFRWDIAVTPTPPLKSASVYVAYTDAGFSVYYEEGGAA